MSSLIESTYSVSSLVGLVSSKRRLVFPPYFWASPKLMQMLFACPRWRYPLGSGGKRVITLFTLPDFRSSSIISSRKLSFFGSSAVGFFASSIVLSVLNSQKYKNIPLVVHYGGTSSTLIGGLPTITGAKTGDIAPVDDKKADDVSIIFTKC